MVCYHPVKCIYPIHSDYDGKRRLAFGSRITDFEIKDYECRVIHSSEDIPFGSNKRIYFRNDSFDYNTGVYQYTPSGIEITVPCGKCIGCLLDKSRSWATRSMHEYQIQKEVYGQESCFVTLTFNDEMLHQREKPDSLNKKEFQKFIKRMRKAISERYNKEIRIFGCGEYGSKSFRPHYHLIIYGFNFPDRKIFKYKKGIAYYRSEFLESIWKPPYSEKGYGFSVIGDCTFESSAYVARYCTKKIMHNYDERLKGKEPEYIISPRKVGLGYEYFVKYYKDIFNHGYVTLPNGKTMFIPTYYVNKLKDFDYDLYEEYRLKNLTFMLEQCYKENVDETVQRLQAREELKKMQCDRLIRVYEMDAFLHNIYYKYLSKGYKKASKCLELLDFDFNLEINDARQAIMNDTNKYNFVFLDAFTPTKCPCLWSIDFFKLLYEHLEDGGLILTYSNSAQVRNCFLNAGFIVKKIFSKNQNKFTGTVAIKPYTDVSQNNRETNYNTELIHDLSDYDLGLMKSRAGIFYRDKDLSLDNEAIINNHKIEVENSNLISSSKFIKTYKRGSC